MCDGRKHSARLGQARNHQKAIRKEGPYPHVGSWERWLAGSNRDDHLPPASLHGDTLSSPEGNFRIPFGSARCRSTGLPSGRYNSYLFYSYGFVRYPRISFSSMLSTWITPSDCSLPTPWVCMSLAVHAHFRSAPPCGFVSLK